MFGYSCQSTLNISCELPFDKINVEPCVAFFYQLKLHFCIMFAFTFFTKPVLSDQPVLSGQYAIPEGYRLFTIC